MKNDVASQNSFCNSDSLKQKFKLYSFENFAFILFINVTIALENINEHDSSINIKMWFSSGWPKIRNLGYSNYRIQSLD